MGIPFCARIVGRWVAVGDEGEPQRQIGCPAAEAFEMSWRA